MRPSPSALSASQPRLPGVLRSFPAGSKLYSRGERFSGVYQIIHGRVVLFTADHHGHETVVQVARPGDVVGGVESLDHGPHATSARTTAPSLLLFVSAAELDPANVAAGRAETHLVLAHSIRKLLRRVVILSHGNVADRLLAFLTTRVQTDGRGGGWVEIPETRAQLAAELATTRESLSRALARLRREGVLQGSGSRLYLSEAVLRRTVQVEAMLPVVPNVAGDAGRRAGSGA